MPSFHVPWVYLLIENWSCPIISYGIFDGKKPDHKDKPLGLIKNFCRDCPEEFFTKADRFGIDFPEEATAKQKLLLINAAIWLNYLQYEFSWKHIIDYCFIKI